MAARRRKKAAAPRRRAAARLEHITVRVGQLPGRIEDIALNGGRTVGDAIKGAGLAPDGYEIKVNGVDAGTDQELEEGHTVLLVRKIAGA